LSVKDVPEEYIIYTLCNKFKCLPSQLEKEDSYLIDSFIEIMGIEGDEIKSNNNF